MCEILDYVFFSFCGVILCLRNKKDLGRHLTPSSSNSCSLQSTSHAGKWGCPQPPLESLLTFPSWALGWRGMWTPSFEATACHVSLGIYDSEEQVPLINLVFILYIYLATQDVGS